MGLLPTPTPPPPPHPPSPPFHYRLPAGCCTWRFIDTAFDWLHGGVAGMDISGGMFGRHGWRRQFCRVGMEKGGHNRDAPVHLRPPVVDGQALQTLWATSSMGGGDINPGLTSDSAKASGAGSTSIFTASRTLLHHNWAYALPGIQPRATCVLAERR